MWITIAGVAALAALVGTIVLYAKATGRLSAESEYREAETETARSEAQNWADQPDSAAAADQLRKQARAKRKGGA